MKKKNWITWNLTIEAIIMDSIMETAKKNIPWKMIKIEKFVKWTILLWWTSPNDIRKNETESVQEITDNLDPFLMTSKLKLFQKCGPRNFSKMFWFDWEIFYKIIEYLFSFDNQFNLDCSQMNLQIIKQKNDKHNYSLQTIAKTNVLSILAMWKLYFVYFHIESMFFIQHFDFMKDNSFFSTIKDERICIS